MSNVIKIDPFKIKTSKETSKVSSLPVKNKKVETAIDTYRAIQAEIKKLEADASPHKKTIMGYAKDLWAKRTKTGLSDDSFRIAGNENTVTYVAMDSSSSLDESDLTAFGEQWSPAAAEELIVRDLSSIKFNTKILENNYDLVVAALQTLPEEVLEELFEPMTLKAAPNAADKGLKYCSNAKELVQLITDLKLKHHLR